MAERAGREDAQRFSLVPYVNDARGQRVEKGDRVAVPEGDSWTPGIVEAAWQAGEIGHLEVWGPRVIGVCWYPAAQVLKLSSARNDVAAWTRFARGMEFAR